MHARGFGLRLSGLLALVASGCGEVKAHTSDASSDSDSEDATVNEPDASRCFGAQPFNVCLSELPTDPVTLPNMLDTSDSPLCSTLQYWQDVNQDPACFIVGTTITVPTSRVVGSKPLVLVATNSIEIVGYMDAAGHNSPEYRPGVGAPGLPCPDFLRMPAQGSTAAGGGAGGTFQTRAGAGGSGAAGAYQGGVADVAIATPATLRGGCDGQRGMAGQSSAGQDGAPGGAVYFVTHGTISLSASAILNASGAGASSSGATAGGSGGGSGGMIVLHASALAIAPGAVLIANGGGGSSGGGANGPGTPGADPDPTQPLIAASGGVGGGGSGGAGFVESAAAMDGSNGGSTAGGGGGGGGAGYIRANHPLTTAIVSPSPQIVP